MRWLALLLVTVFGWASATPAAAQTATPTETPTLTPTPTVTPTPIRQSLVPIGSIQMYAGDTPPPGWLWCDGSAVGRGDYPELFAVIGVTFGAGDGSSTFNLPDCAGRVPVGTGWGTSLTPRNLGDQWGAETHVLSTTEMPAHAHQVLGNGLGTLYWGSGSGSFATMAQTTIGSLVSRILYTASAGGGQAHNNMQPSLAMGFIVWTGSVALELPSGGGGGGGGYDPVITPTPAPEIIYYATVQVGESSANTAFAMSVSAGEFAIALFLAGIFGLLLIQMVWKAREAQ